MVTIAEFRERFLDFSDSGAYPDSRIQLFLDDSSLLIGDNWGTCKDLGIMYLTAHYLVISNAENSGITSSALTIWLFQMQKIAELHHQQIR
jgi:hypothetical protein